MGNLTWISDFTTRGKLKAKPMYEKTVNDGATSPSDTGITAFGPMIWGMDNTVCGYNALASTQVETGDVFFGSWQNVLLGMWGAGVDLMVDPYTLSTAGNVRVTAIQTVDVAVRYPQAFYLLTEGS